MDFTRSPFKPVNRPSTPCNLSTLSAPKIRFCAAVDHVVVNHQLPSEFQNDYVRFLRLAIEVLSAKAVTKKCRTAFQTFVSVVHTLPADARESMHSALVFFKPDPPISSLFNQLTHSLNNLYLKEQEAIKIEQIKRLESSTAVPRERGDARYPADLFADLPHLQSFMQSERLETRLYGFSGLVHARRELKALAPRLPEGSLFEVLGKGKRAYIAIKKPCWKQRQLWNTYCADKEALQKARDGLKLIQADIPRFEHNRMDSAPKRRKKKNM